MRAWLYRIATNRANGQPAFGCLLNRTPERGLDRRQRPAEDRAGIVVLTMTGHRISGITRFLDADLQRRFDLAAPGAGGAR